MGRIPLHPPPRVRAALVIAFGLAALGATQTAAAQSHRVRKGDTLVRIAQKYQVPTHSIVVLNELQPNQLLQIGKAIKIPPRGVVFVRQGETIATLARRHNVSEPSLRKRNKLSAKKDVRPGQRVVIPGFSGKSNAEAHAESEQKRRELLAEPVEIWRPVLFENATASLVDESGRPRPEARRHLRHLMRDRHSGKSFPVDTRLIRAVASIAAHYPGHAIEIVSGYRAPSADQADTSRHTSGSAIDFRVKDIPNEEVRDFCLTLENVGVGYYPRSSFVHIDVRDQSAYWVDWSRPGEPPLYLAPGEVPEDMEPPAVDAKSTDDQIAD